jgi:hypothetical protein
MPSADYGAVGLDEIIGDDDDDDDIIGIDEIIGDDEQIDEALEEILLEGEDDDDDDDEDDFIAGDDDDDDDDDDEIGARRRRRPTTRRRRTSSKTKRRAAALLKRARAKRRKMARAAKRLKAARTRDPNAVSVRGVKRQRRRRLIVPIPVTTVAAGGTAEVTIQPQRLFKCKRFIVPSGVAGDFRFTDIKVGQQSQLAASGDVPAAAFTEVTVDGYVDFDSSDIGNLIVFEVSNTDAVNPHDLEGVLLGTAVY